MLHHIEIYVADAHMSNAFWKELLGFIGYRETANWGEGFTLSDDRDAYLTFVQVTSSHAAKTFHRCGVGLNHLAFRVASRESVDALRRHCLSKGHRCLYDDRYPYANGGTDYYALFIEDPDRIKVEFVAER